jgi:hypothetical protein
MKTQTQLKESIKKAGEEAIIGLTHYPITKINPIKDLELMS